MANWLLDNLIAIIALLGSIGGLIIGFIKMNERMHNQLQIHEEEIQHLRDDLKEEQRRNRENYNKQDSKLEEAIRSFNNRLEKIDEMNKSINELQKEIATIKTDISYIKDDVKEVKQDVKVKK